MKVAKHIAKGFFIFLLLLIILLLAGGIALQNPKVQTKLATIFTDSMSKKLNTKVTVGGVDVDFFTQVNINDFYIEDQKGDTLFYAGTIHSKAITFSPFQNTFLLKDSRLSDVKVRIHRGPTDSLSNLDRLFVKEEPTITGKKKRKRNRQSLNLGFDDALIENFDFQLHDELEHQETDINLPRFFVDFDRFSIGKKIIKASDLQLERPYISLVTTEFTDEQTTDTTKFATPNGWDFSVDQLKIQDGTFISRSTAKVKGQDNMFQFGNFAMRQLQLDANNVSAKENELKLHLEHGEFIDESGFQVNQLQAETLINGETISLEQLVLETPYSQITGELAFGLNYLSDFSDFENKIRIKGKFRNARLAPKDIAYLLGSSPIDERITISGDFNGKLRNLDADNFELRFAHGSYLRGDVHTRGLPEIEDTFFDAKIRQLSTTQAGLRKIFQKELPEQVTRFGDISYSGEFTGYISDLITYGTLKTEIGTFETDINYSNKNDVPTYSGYLASNDFNIGYWLNSPDLGTIDFSGSIRGSEFDLARMNSELDLDINSFVYKNKTHENISVQGTIQDQLFDGKLLANDPHHLTGEIVGQVSLGGEQTNITFTSDIQKANLYELGIMEDPFSVTGKFNAQLSGKDFESLQGTIEAFDATVTTNDRTIPVEEASILIEDKDGQQSITAKTNTINANFTGYFKYTELVPTVLKTVNTYYDFGKGWENSNKIIDSNEKISFDIDVDKEDELLALFVDGLTIYSDISAEGFLTPATNEISLVAETKDIGWKDFSITDWKIDAIGTGDILVINSFQKELLNEGKRWLVNSELNFELSGGDEIIADVRVYNEDFLSAKLISKLNKLPDNRYRFSILSSELVVNEEQWTIKEDNSITFGNGRWDAENFVLSNDEQRIEIYNPVGDLSTKLIANLENVELEDINQLIGFTQKPFGGQLSGEARIVQMNGQNNVDVSANIAQFMYNNDVVQTVTLDGLYNLTAKNGNFEGILNDPDYQAGLNVKLDLAKQSDILDLNIDLYRASLSPFGNLWADSVEDLEGFAQGKMHIWGGPNKFNLEGQMDLTEDLLLTLSFTQARYKIAKGQSISIDKNRFGLNNLTIEDPYGNIATASGAITHEDLSNFRLDVYGEYTNFLLLNTTKADNEMFYGKAFADGSLSFTGPVEDARMSVKATSKPNTEIHIDSQTGQNTQSEYSFIRFKQPVVDSIKQEVQERNESKLTMNFDLNIAPTANVYMTFDDEGYTSLQGNGFGNLTINIDTQDLFEMSGFYQVNQGAFILSYAEIITREFDIVPGGVIQWSGDPLGARLNIDAKYTVDADVSNLLQDGSDQGARGSRVETDILVSLTETLANPQFNYNIDVATANTGGLISEQIKLINSNQSLLDTQMFNLLVLDQFANNNSSPFATEQGIGNVAFNSLTGIFTRQLTALLAEVDALRNTNIDLDYENYRQRLADDPDQVFGGLDQQLQIKLQQQIADNVRLKVGSDLNFGENLNTEQNNVFAVGDIIMEIDIDRDGKYEVTLFSKIDYSILSPEQSNNRRNGVSYKFERQGNTFKELFKRPKKQKAKPEKGNPKSQPVEQIDKDSIPSD